MKIQSIKSFAHGLKIWTTKNSPVILAGLGVAGLIGTAVATYKATVKATKIIEKEKRERLKSDRDENENIAGLIKVVDKKVSSKNDPCGTYRLPRKDAFKMTWKYYIPAVILGAGSIACIIGGTVQGQKRLAALSALYSMSQEALKEYQEAAKELVGEKNAEKISAAVQDNHMAKNPCPEEFIKNTGAGITLFYDDFTGRYFRSNIDTVKRTVNDLNAKMYQGGLNMGDHITLNDFYEAIGMDHVRFGEEIGWDGRVCIELAYRSKLNDNDDPCVVIEFVNWPEAFGSSDWSGI